jgi:hypothetical protein
MKRQILILLTFLTFILGGCATGKRSDLTTSGDELTPGQLRFDGMYYREGIINGNRSYGQNYTYLRFYPDGTLIRAVTASKPDDATKWLNKQRYSSSVTNYKLKGNDISFGWKSGNDAMAIDGQVLEDKLRLNVYAGANEYTNDYYFMQMDFDKD